MQNSLPSKSDSDPSRSRPGLVKTHDEFHVITFWIYQERAISHILSKAKAFNVARSILTASHKPGCEIIFQVKEKWFKVVCLKKDTLKVQDRFASLLSSLDQDITWDDVVGQNQSPLDHPWILRFRQPIDDNDTTPNENAIVTDTGLGLAHVLEVPSDFQQYNFVRIFHDIDDLEPEGVICEDIICHKWMAELERLSSVRIAAPGVGRIVYIGGEIRSDVDTAVARLSNIHKRFHEAKPQVQHILYAESSARGTPVEARLCNDINPVLVSGCILDPIHGAKAMLEEYRELKKAVSIRAVQVGPNGKKQSFFGPRSKGSFKAPQGRRYIQQVASWRYVSKQPSSVAGAASSISKAGSYLGEKPTVMGWMQNVTLNPPAGNGVIDSNLGISHEAAAPPISKKLRHPNLTSPARVGLLSQPRAHQNRESSDAVGKQHVMNIGTDACQPKYLGFSRPQSTGAQPGTLQKPKKPWSSAAATSETNATSALDAYRTQVGTQAWGHDTWPAPPPPALASLAEYPALGTPANSKSSLRPQHGSPASTKHPQPVSRSENHLPEKTFYSQHLLEETPRGPQEMNTNPLRPFAFDMEPLIPLQGSSNPHPSIVAHDDRETDTFHRTMRQMAPSRRLQTRSHQAVSLVQSPVTVTMDPDTVFMENLNHKVGGLLEHLRFRRGKVDLCVVFGRAYLKRFTREGLAMNKKYEDHYGWDPEVFLGRMQKRYSSSDDVLFANILSIYGQDAEALHEITRRCAPQAQTDKAKPWEQNGIRVIYEFTCQIGNENAFVVELDAKSFKFEIRYLSNQVAPIVIHCLHRHWDLAVNAACSPVEGVNNHQLCQTFAENLVKSLEIPPNTTGKPQLCYTEAYHNSPNKPIVTALRVLHIVSFGSPDKETQLRVTQVQDMSTTLLPGRHGGWNRYKASVAKESPDQGIFSTWFTASMSSVKADEMLKSNMTLELGDEARWTTEAFLKDGCVHSLFKRALAIVKEMDGIGVLCDNGHGVPSGEVIDIPSSLAQVDFW
ncbi:hypothetical protein PpBr36_00144 [Pyricularia pennisetigena]|uniref:hypothetical protein n=1 Tax=Pyricularia pennisetigena TaxID=1578925 RepID=UPI001153AF69|nr:hypothetical protein PpBr36_00144 [Pyricularia pennisetigena]TLS29307.1 hypothetical protein PpBr36_00144 [Pyricularia pennisetigena]